MGYSEEAVLVILCAITFLVQILLAFFCRKRWVNALPLLIALMFTFALFGQYFYSGNWAFLILAAFAAQILATAIAAWMIYGLYLVAKEVLKKYKL